MKVIVIFAAIVLNGCVGYIIPNSGYVPNYYSQQYYTPPIYSQYYVPTGGYYGGGYARAHAARPCGPTPFEVIYGKGALKKGSRGNHYGGSRR